LPETHEAPVAHAVPQEWQFRGSDATLAHRRASQLSSSGAQQAPFVQARPGGHWMPQPPQFSGSSVPLVQVTPQI
jgi:hypothetical protein